MLGRVELEELDGNVPICLLHLLQAHRILPIVLDWGHGYTKLDFHIIVTPYSDGK